MKQNQKKLKVTTKNIEKAIKKNSRISKNQKAKQREHEVKSINKAMKSQGIETKQRKEISTRNGITIIIVCTIIIAIAIFSFYESGLGISNFLTETIKKLF